MNSAWCLAFFHSKHHVRPSKGGEAVAGKDRAGRQSIAGEQLHAGYCRPAAVSLSIWAGEVPYLLHLDKIDGTCEGNGLFEGPEEQSSGPFIFGNRWRIIKAPKQENAMSTTTKFALLDALSMQAAMKLKGFYSGSLDGQFGPASKLARDAMLNRFVGMHIIRWDDTRRTNALAQLIMKQAGLNPGAVDGLIGPQTRFALEQWQNGLRDRDHPEVPFVPAAKQFPRYSQMEAFYGKPGTNLVRMKTPYKCRIAWDKEKSIEAFMIHKLCAPTAQEAMEEALEHYGYDGLVELGLDLFGGCYNERAMKGGTRLSTHSWGAAIDWDPERNQLRWGSDRAVMDNADRRPFLDAWERRGWVSLGRARNFDWMHLQACRL